MAPNDDNDGSPPLKGKLRRVSNLESTRLSEKMETMALHNEQVEFEDQDAQTSVHELKLANEKLHAENKKLQAGNKQFYDDADELRTMLIKVTREKAMLTEEYNKKLWADLSFAVENKSLRMEIGCLDEQLEMLRSEQLYRVSSNQQQQDVPISEDNRRKERSKTVLAALELRIETYRQERDFYREQLDEERNKTWDALQFTLSPPMFQPEFMGGDQA